VYFIKVLGLLVRFDRLTLSLRILVHAFVTSCADYDYCNTMLARSPISTNDRLQWVLNATAHVVSGTGKFDRGLTQLHHFELHCLYVSNVSLE